MTCGIYAFTPVHCVHFVDREDEMLDSEQVRDGGVAQGLAADALDCVDENDGGVGGGRAGGHVAGVLLVTRSISDAETALLGSEKAIGHVDCDALFAFSFEAVREQGEVDLATAAVYLALLDRFDLVFVCALGVKEQASDERTFSVVHTAGGGESQCRLHLEIALPVSSISMEPS